jgi:type IV pilus assembly protein PilP
MSHRLATFALCSLSLFGLAACGDGSEDEVRQWMAETRSKAHVVVPKVTAPKTFSPFTYTAMKEVDPFNPQKLSVALAKQFGAGGNGIRPNLDRRKEALEAFPLDAITMVGTLQKPGMSYALLRVDKTVYRATLGNYIGQNFGRITKITDSAVELKEIVRDASGEWVERNAKLELQEKQESKK